MLIFARLAGRMADTPAGEGSSSGAQAAAAPAAKLQQTMEAVKAKLPAGMTGGSSEGPKDHELYDALGVSDDASKAEIRAAYAERKHEVRTVLVRPSPSACMGSVCTMCCCQPTVAMHRTPLQC